MPRTLLILDDAPIIGGAELFALRLAVWLGRERPDWTARIVCPPASAFAGRCAATGINVSPAEYPELTAAAAPRMVPAIARLRGLLREAHADGSLVMANTARAQAYAAAARIGPGRTAPVVNLVHEQETAARRSAQVVLGRVGRIVAVGENAASTYRRALPGQPVEQLNNFLDPAVLRSAVEHRAVHAHRRPPVIGVLARLIPEKGVLPLVEELATLHDSWVQLLVGGAAQDAAYAHRLRTRIIELQLADRVRLLDHVEDLQSFFDDVDVLVVPSIGNEGQPTVILEALAHGRPVVVRQAVWSPDFAGLPVAAYDTAADLHAALARDDAPATEAELARRFGPQQALDALLAAGQS